MLFLLDTNALSDIIRNHSILRSRIAQRSKTDQVITCVIAWGELCFGSQRLPPSKKRLDLEAKIKELEAEISCREIPMAAANHYARLKQACKARGRALNENDLWIAATAAALGAVLISRDLDFSGITAIQIEDWTKP
jgi:predicted nucleic acid-binding protein